MKSSDVLWCQRIFNMLAEGGEWAVPRNGLIFQKKSGSLVLVARMPYDTPMPLSASELRAYQDDDYAAIKRHFEVAGISVTDSLDS